MSAVQCFELPASPQEVKRIPLCRSGRFFRVDQGRFSVVLQQLKDMKRNAIERGVHIPLKLTHQDDTAAIGWIDPRSLTIEQTGRGVYILYGNAELTITPERLAELRASRSAYYISPEIVWQTHRMAESEYGKAGDPVGPSLVGAAAVLDPFFALPPVQFARALRQALGRPNMPQRYNAMLDDKQIEAIKGLLKEKGMPEENASDAVLALMSLLMGGAAEPEPEAEMEAQPEVGAAPAIQAARDAQFSAMAKRLEALEKEKAERDAESRAALFAAYDREGRLRFADKGEAKRLLDTHGAGAFAAAYGRVPALTEQPAPAAPATLPTAASVSTGDPTRVEDSEVRAYLARPGNEGISYRQALKTLSAERKRSN